VFFSWCRSYNYTCFYFNESFAYIAVNNLYLIFFLVFLTLKGVGIGYDHGREGMDYEDADEMIRGVRFLDQSQKGIAPCAELKDKGLCLVPLSMLLNYQG
jgi:hypothetical protein